MPTYEFRCPNGHEFEQFYSRISLAPSTVECPTCGLVSEKLMSAGAGLVFKGSGFYITDYGKDGKKDQQKSTTTSKADGSPGGDASASASGDAKAPGEPAKTGDAKSSGDTKSSSESKPASSDAKPAKAAEPAAPKSPPKASGGDA